MHKLSDNHCMFTFNHWQYIVNRYAKAKYKFVVLSDLKDKIYRKNIKYINIRHDVENRVDIAVKLAEIEHKLGVRSNYFIRVHSPNYNIFSQETKHLLKYLLEMDHEIGLHTELFDFGYTFNEDPRIVLKREKKYLELAVNRKVTTVAPHGDYSRKMPEWSKILDDPSVVTMKHLKCHDRKLAINDMLNVIRKNIKKLKIARYIKSKRSLNSKHMLNAIDIKQFGFVASTRDEEYVGTFFHYGDGPGYFKPKCPCIGSVTIPRVVINAHPHWWFNKYYHLT